MNRFAQKRLLGRKVSDEFSVPLCPIATIASYTARATNPGGVKAKIARVLWKTTRLPSPSKLQNKVSPAADATRD
jgi:hypothetical protein